MKGSLVTCALIILVAGLLGWREYQQLSRKKEANAKLLAEAAAMATDGGRTAGGGPIPNDSLDRRDGDRLTKAEVTALARDYFALFRQFGGNPNGEADEELKRLKAEMKTPGATSGRS